MAEQSMQSFELALNAAMSLPGVRINRENFLRRELQKYCEKQWVEVAVKQNLAAARISEKVVGKIARGCIDYETNKSSILSFAAGIPGGVAMAATMPADLVQYFGHMFRIMQKLLYLYDCECLLNTGSGVNEIDDETRNIIILMMGIMFGVDQAGVVITQMCKAMGQKAAKALAQKALTKTIYYPIVKQVAQAIGVRMTKEIFAEGVAKAIPIVGGIMCGGITYVTFKPMSIRLQKYLIGLKFGLGEKDK